MPLRRTTAPIRRASWPTGRPRRFTSIRTARIPMSSRPVALRSSRARIPPWHSRAAVPPGHLTRCSASTRAAGPRSNSPSWRATSMAASTTPRRRSPSSTGRLDRQLHVLPAGYIADATTGGAATLVTSRSVTLPAAADDQPLVQVRVITADAPNNDEWVGIDDVAASGTATNQKIVRSNSMQGWIQQPVDDGDGNTASGQFVFGAGPRPSAWAASSTRWARRRGRLGVADGGIQRAPAGRS